MVSLVIRSIFFSVYAPLKFCMCSKNKSSYPNIHAVAEDFADYWYGSKSKMSVNLPFYDVQKEGNNFVLSSSFVMHKMYFRYSTYTNGATYSSNDEDIPPPNAILQRPEQLQRLREDRSSSSKRYDWNTIKWNRNYLGNI